MMPANQDDPRRRQPNIARAVKELGWRPVVSSRALCTFSYVVIIPCMSTGVFTGWNSENY